MSHILKPIFEDYVKQIKPLLDVLNNVENETKDFRLAIVHKCPVTLGYLDHEWERLKCSSLNDKQFRHKVNETIKECIDAGGLVYDVVAEITYANTGVLKDEPVEIV